ncbi:hypothetical protein SKAU_G00195040 [Synaphobranchus kaupii]|uniref:Uncharacterized protein n=1 Tax=Synaphobranchus kaupii TaxID=118154 RepID=A0A9Q1IXS8_SYNKA|nr:hypothetical protein SKAU_G00195040 [Synaphobranchus kaupii]
MVSAMGYELIKKVISLREQTLCTAACEDYEEGYNFDVSGRLVRKRTNRLKPEATPSVFDFTKYSTGSTDRPTQGQSVRSVHPRERAQKRSNRKEQEEVSYGVA